MVRYLVCLIVMLSLSIGSGLQLIACRLQGLACAPRDDASMDPLRSRATGRPDPSAAEIHGRSLRSNDAETPALPGPSPREWM